ncbi:MAG: hypothetical protein LBJ07_01610 [Actinomycetes bacterium]|nr:hypothetical protein [Actinomycetes bacterium]
MSTSKPAAFCLLIPILVLGLAACQGRDAHVATKTAQPGQQSAETLYDRYAQRRADILQQSGARIPRPDTRTPFQLARIPSFQARKVISTLSPEIEDIAAYFAQHPQLGTGIVQLELNTGDMPYDLRRVVVSGELHLGEMRQPIEEVLKATPFDMVIYIDYDAISFQTHFYDHYGEYLTEEIIYMDGSNLSFGEAAEEGLIRIAPDWYYVDFISVS